MSDSVVPMEREASISETQESNDMSNVELEHEKTGIETVTHEKTDVEAVTPNEESEFR